MTDHRPDSLTATAPAEPGGTAPEQVRTASHKRHRAREPHQPMVLKLTSMIDVVFLLLIYFVVSANFQVDEGALLATLPGNSSGPNPMPVPVVVGLTSADGGVTCDLTVDGRPVDGVSALYATLRGKIVSGEMPTDTPVVIKSQKAVRWQHVVNAFNACVRAELEQAAFSP